MDCKKVHSGCLRLEKNKTSNITCHPYSENVHHQTRRCNREVIFQKKQTLSRGRKENKTVRTLTADIRSFRWNANNFSKLTGRNKKEPE